MRTLHEKDFEWRCICDKKRSSTTLDLKTQDVTYKKNAGHPRLVSTPSEQSFTCPERDCIETFTHPYVKGNQLITKACQYEFVERIKMPQNRRHHCIIIGLDNRLQSARQGVVAFHYALRLLIPDPYRLIPIFPESAIAWKNMKKAQNAPLDKEKPFGMYLYKPEYQWPLMVYLHHFPPALKIKSIGDKLKLSDCGHSNTIVDRMSNAHTLALVVHSKHIFKSEEQRAKNIADTVKLLVKKIENKGINSANLNLWIVLAEQERFFQKLESSEKGVTPFKPTFPIDDTTSEIVKNYLLYSARLLDLLQPILDLPWKNIKYGMFGSVVDTKDSIATLEPWVEECLRQTDEKAQNSMV